jgi:hypothetical protein
VLADALDLDLPPKRELARWLGARGALFLVDRQGETVAGVVLDTTDADAALRFLRREVSGPEHTTVVREVRGRVVLGAPAAVRAAVDARRGSLAGEARYRAMSAGGAPFAILLVDLARTRIDLLDALGPSPQTDALRALMGRRGRIDVGLHVSEREALIRVDRPRRADEQPESIASLPGDAWLAVSTDGRGELLANPLGRALGSRLSLRRLLGDFTGARLPSSLLRQLRRGTLYLQGNGRAASGELRAEVRNRRAADRAMLRYAAALRRTSGHTVEVFRSGRANPGIFTHVPGEESEGEAVTETFLTGRTLSLVFGATGSAEYLEDSPLYREAERALGEAPTTLVDLRGLLEVIDPAGGFADGGARRLKLFAAAESPRGKRFRWTVLVRLRR